MNFNDLFNNNFVKAVIDRNTSMAKKSIELDPKLEEKRGRDKLSAKEIFIVDTFYYMNEILSKVETLNYCFVFLNSYPKRRMWDKTFGRAEYIRYHLESYYTNMTSVLDRCLLLVNLLYDLGIQENYVRLGPITSNKHLQDQPVKKILDRFDTALSGIKEIRHLIIHRGRFSEEELADLERYEFISRKGVKLTEKERGLIACYLKVSFSAYVSRKKKEVRGNNEAAYKLCDMFFSSLETKYLERLNAL